MKLCVLVDNTPDVREDFVAQHGLSIWMEHGGEKWLVDTGLSDAYALNASRLGIDIAEVDYLVLSHGHIDHSGGLETFLLLNNKAKIFLSANICNNHYYSTRHGAKRDISLNHSLIEKYHQRFIFVDKNTKVNSSVNIITSFLNNNPKPLANNTLLANDSLDDFNHEIAVEVTTDSGIVIVSPCSHNGVINTIEGCKNGMNVSYYIGGTHLVDGYESNEDLLHLTTTIKCRYPQLKLISGHCTGNNAKKVFHEELNDNFIEFYTGFSLVIE